MRFHEVAEAFSRLEATTGRYDVLDILAGLLHRAAEDDLDAIVFLAQGQLRPPYEGVELGFGEKTLLKVLAETYGRRDAEVLRRLRALGDLGLVAAELAAARGPSRLDVTDVYRALLAIARESGPGSSERKSAALAALLRQLSPQEVKYVVRIAQGRLRLGVGDQTILGALAIAALGDGAKKDIVEHAYNIRPDLGWVARLAYREGENGLRTVKPALGVPVRPALAQRLASPEEIIEKLGRVQVEPKYDGFRLQLHRDGDRVWAFSRRLENVSEMFPDVTAAVRTRVRARRAILEGEAIVHNPDTGEYLPFQVTMTRRRKYRIEEMAERYPLRCFAFDLLLADGTDYIPRPLRERRAALERLVAGGADEPLAVAEAHVVSSAEALQHHFDEAIALGLEGVVAKRLDAPYHAGARNYNWVKLKRTYRARLEDTVDVVLVGYFVGRGKRAALGIGSLLGAVYDPVHDRFRTVCKIGSGPSDEEWRQLKALLDEIATPRRPPRVDSLITPDVWVEPRYVVAVLADEITRSPSHTCGKRDAGPGYALRFPRVVGLIRADKGPEDATTEAEILDLYARAHRATPAQAAKETTEAVTQAAKAAKEAAKAREERGAARAMKAKKAAEKSTSVRAAAKPARTQPAARRKPRAAGRGAAARRAPLRRAASASRAARRAAGSARRASARDAARSRRR